MCILALLVGLFEYSTSPRFCNSCHIMRPYYEAWKTSKHDFVPCVECHYPPGKRDELRVKFQAMSQIAKYVTRTYGSKPYAEVEDASCLREGCHETRLLEGRVTFKRGIIFDHKPHLTEPRRGRKLRCTSCHSQIVVGTHMVVTENTCFLCHFKDTGTGREERPLAGCPSCHEPPSGAINVGGVEFRHDEFVGSRHVPCQKCHLDAIRGDGRAPGERCSSCHNEPEKLKSVTDLPGLHDNHVTVHNVECSRCHEEILHSVRTTTTPLEYGCNVCHENKHLVQKEMFMGTGGKGFPNTPGHMFLAQLDCIACHTQPLVSGDDATLVGQTYAASEKACIECHGEKYLGMLKSWQRTFDKMGEEISPKLAAASSAVQNARKESRLTAAVGELLADASHNIRFVRLGRGVHNVFYAAGLLHTANERIDQILESLGEKPLPLGKHSYLGGDYCAVLCHEQADVKMPETVKVLDRTLPHRRHFYEHNVPCTSCHSSTSHKEVTLKPESCSDCHHAPATGACVDCHKLQASLYEGTFTGGVPGEKTPSLMADVVDCTGCHTEVKHGKTAGTVSNSCKTCHDESYAEILSAWRTQVKSVSREAQQKLAVVRDALQKQKGRAYAGSPEAASIRRLGETITSLSPTAAVHNPELSERILRRVMEELEEVGRQEGTVE